MCAATLVSYYREKHTLPMVNKRNQRFLISYQMKWYRTFYGSISLLKKGQLSTFIMRPFELWSYRFIFIMLVQFQVLSLCAIYNIIFLKYYPNVQYLYVFLHCKVSSFHIYFFYNSFQTNIQEISEKHIHSNPVMFIHERQKACLISRSSQES